MSNAKPFTALQLAYIKKGDILTEQLEHRIIRALGKADLQASAKRHACIVGGPGIGKTHTVNATALKYGVELVRIQGVASMNAIAIQLAVVAFMRPDEEVYVWIDDCDNIFMSTESLSVMKGILDEDRNLLAWNKNLTAQIAIFEKSEDREDKLKAEALRSFQPVGGVGVEIPTNNMRFIITSNRYLAAPNPPPKTQRKIDESTIRDRVDYKDYLLNKNEAWGWMASVALKADIFGIDNDQKLILLNWMFDYWDRLASTSMRAIRELAADMVNYPDDYPDQWDSRLISTLQK